MRIEPFKPEHLAALLLQPSQALFQPMLASKDYGKMLYDAGPAYAVILDDNVVACLGIIPQWEGRAIAWGLVGTEAGKAFVSLHKAVKRFLDLQDYHRIETAVSTDFEQGHRWAQLLGFENEGTMRAYTPDGRDCDLYARIKCKPLC